MNRARNPIKPSEPALRSWLPTPALQVAVLDTSRWQTRAARGISWHRSGSASRNDEQLAVRH
jgi:hypothetical protein